VIDRRFSSVKTDTWQQLGAIANMVFLLGVRPLAAETEV
jgi:hypothetical protein